MMDTGLIISLIALVIATASTLISYLIYRSSTEPEVVVYADTDRTRPSIVLLIVENIGNGVAWNVRFEIDDSMPMKAWGFDDAEQPARMTEGPLVTGIPSFGPKARRVISWGQYHGIHKAIGYGTIDVVAKYQCHPRLAFWRRDKTTTSRLDIKSFEHTDASDDNWDRKTAENIDAPNKTLSRVTTEIRRFLNRQEKRHSDEGSA
nr:putative integron gene cassette protein [uncultured bacterium]